VCINSDRRQIANLLLEGGDAWVDSCRSLLFRSYSIWRCQNSFANVTDVHEEAGFETPDRNVGVSVQRRAGWPDLVPETILTNRCQRRLDYHIWAVSLSHQAPHQHLSVQTLLASGCQPHRVVVPSVWNHATNSPLSRERDVLTQSPLQKHLDSPTEPVRIIVGAEHYVDDIGGWRHVATQWNYKSALAECGIRQAKSVGESDHGESLRERRSVTQSASRNRGGRWTDCTLRHRPVAGKPHDCFFTSECA